MNLRAIANAATQSINPNTQVTVKVSSGYTTDPATRRQVPAYTTETGQANIQSLDGKDLKQLDGLNIQGTIRAAYLYGNLAGVVRPDSKGGDLIEFNSQSWLVVKVLETWPDWCKVAIVYQGVTQ
ncbi:hypothetical protein [Pseudomonas sp.]|uniref:hypothetical protein n=1 Tax=Pseudomonas sp. TaxID=306 RepID=UPI002FC9EF63